MRKFDADPRYIEWSSEELIVPYRCRTDNRIHRYFPDFVVKVKRGNVIETCMVEVKPEAQTKEPVKRKHQKHQTFITEVMTYAKNKSKWEAAEEYCKDRKWKFMILTEKDINGR